MWYLKHRPSSVDDGFVFQNDFQKEKIAEYIKEKDFPHLLFKGVRGTGKTTLANILISATGVDESDVLRFNGSTDNSVDMVRNQIMSHIMKTSWDEGSPFKVVFIDEADYLSANAQHALRHILEEHADKARFIFTLNKPHKIIPELKDRFTLFTFNGISTEDMLLVGATILNEENINVKNAQKTLKKYVELSKPSLRKFISLLEVNTVDGLLNPEPNEDDKDLESMVRIVEAIEGNNWEKARASFCNEISEEAYEDVYKFLYDYLHEIGIFAKDVKKWKAGICIIAEHLHRHNTSAVFPEINFSSCIIKLSEV